MRGHLPCPERAHGGWHRNYARDPQRKVGGLGASLWQGDLCHWAVLVGLLVPSSPKRMSVSQAVDAAHFDRLEASSFSGLFTRVEIDHIRIRSAGSGRMRSRGSGR